MEKREHIAEMIHTHRFRADAVPATLEAKILFEADKLDAIGIGQASAASGFIPHKLYSEQGEFPSKDPLEYSPMLSLIGNSKRL